RSQREPVAHLGLRKQIGCAGDTRWGPQERRAHKSLGLAGKRQTDQAAVELFQACCGDFAQRDRRTAGISARLEANHRRLSHRKRQAVQDVNLRNKCAGCLLEVWPPGPSSRPVSRDTRNGQELPAPSATLLEAWTERA